MSEVSKVPLPNYTEIKVYDEHGEIQSRKFFRSRSSNGKGWLMVYTEKVNMLLDKCPPSTFRVFMALAMGQQFDERGMITTKRAIQERLGMTKQTCLAAFKWLKENFIINEWKNAGGYTEFMVNPEFVTVGKDKKKRMAEWVRRWQGQTVLTLPASGSPIGAIKEPKKKEKKDKSKRRLVVSD